MESETPIWMNLFLSWLPILLVIFLWILFMRRLGGGRQRQQMEGSIRYMERSEQLLERIARALEERNRLQGS